MYALFVEVNVDPSMVSESMIKEARKGINETAVPMAREHGATAAYWLAPAGGRGVSFGLFDTEAEAQKAADSLEVGGQAGPMPDVTFRTVEVREVIAQL